MRAPGAPTSEEIASQRQAQLEKVHYYLAKYVPLRDGIQQHSIRVADQAEFAEFLSARSIDFAFVSIDQRTECDSPASGRSLCGTLQGEGPVHRFGGEYHA